MNRKTKIALLLCIIGMSIGFASVSTVLYLSGNTNIASNTGDFDVYYSKAVENGVENSSLIKDKTHIEFTTELTGLNDKYVLDYDVTNASKQYDANLVMNCVGGNEYLRVENGFDTSKVLPTRTTRSGRVTLTVIKAPLTEMSVSISCEISGNAVERDIAGGESINIEKDYLVIAEGEETRTPETYDPYLGCTLNRNAVETINIMDSKEVPAGAILLGDVSNSQNGSIVMYTKDEDHDNKLELYIGQDGGVVANPNSKNLFAAFENVTEINGLENLDTSHVTNMSGMFRACHNLKELDLSKWNTSKVTNMFGMFFACGELRNLNLSNFDTGNVEDMRSMFCSCYYLTTTLTIRGTKCTKYEKDDMLFSYNMFDNAATRYGTKITVNYTKDASELVDKMIATGTGHIVKGHVVSDYLITLKDKFNVTYNGDIITLSPKDNSYTIASFKLNGNLIEGNTFTMPDEEITITDIVLKQVIFDITVNGNDTIFLSNRQARKGDTIVLYGSAPTPEATRVITSFKMNGTLVIGDSFTMPEENVVITDVVVKEATIIETRHNPYPGNLDDEVYGEKTFEGATSLTVILDMKQMLKIIIGYTCMIVQERNMVNMQELRNEKQSLSQGIILKLHLQQVMMDHTTIMDLKHL